MSPSCSYTSHGTKTVTLTVTDDEGDYGDDTLQVSVQPVVDELPVAIIEGGDRTVNRDPNTKTVQVSFDGSNSHDPDDGTGPGDGIESYVWYFGDGTNTEGSLSPSGNSIVSHNLPDSGQYERQACGRRRRDEYRRCRRDSDGVVETGRGARG